jgi:hypothetical protein
MQVLVPGNVRYPAVSFSNSQNTGMYLAAANTVGISTGNVASMTIDATGLTVAPFGTKRFAANATTVLANIPFQSASFLGFAPVFVNPPAYDLSVTALPNQVNGSSVVAWTSATGVAGNGTYPILKTFSSEAVDKYVSIAGNATQGSYFTLGQTTWNVATNSGFTSIARVRFTTSNVAQSADECILDFGTAANYDNIVVCRNGTEANVAFRVYTGTLASPIVAVTPAPIITGGFQTIACRLIRLQTSPEIWGATIFNNGSNVVTTTTTFTKDVLANKVVTSYIGRPNTPTVSNCYSTLDIQSIQLFDYPLSDAEIASMTTYLSTKFTGLFNTIASATGGGVTVDAGTGTPLALTTSNDVTGVRSVNGVVMRGLRPWVPPNLMRYDILGMMRASRDACYPMTSRLDAVRVLSGNYPGNYAFLGSVLMHDGRVFMVPYNATAGRIYDPVTDTVTVTGGTFPGLGSFTGGLLLPDSRIFCIPYSANGNGYVYTPWTDSVSVTVSIGSHQGGVVLNDGRVFLCTQTSNQPALYDPIVNTVTRVNVGTVSTAVRDLYVGAVLLPDGRAYCVPYNASQALLYDPSTNTVTYTSVTFPGGGAYWGGVLMPDGRIFNVPHTATSACLYDPTTDTATFVGGFPGNYGLAGGCLLPCGRVACAPWQTPAVYIYDPATDIVSQASGTIPTNNAHAGATLLPDGRAFFPPANGAQARMLNSSWGTVRPPLSVLTSPFYNKL